MKALTIQQPWGWAVVAGHKPVENRTQKWSHRGELAIHAGQRWSERGWESPLVQAAVDQHRREIGWEPEREEDLPFGVRPKSAPPMFWFGIIGTVNLVDIHVAHEGCCESPWAEQSYVEHGGRTRRRITHLMVEDPVEFNHPIPCGGALGLWTVDTMIEQLVRDERAATLRSL